MFSKALFIVVVAFACAFATKPVVTKVVKADTSYKMDTVVSYDTLVISRLFRDTAVFVKAETTKTVPKAAKTSAKK